MKIIANKWLWLTVFVLSWTVAGVAMFSNDTPAITEAPGACPQRIVAMAPNLTEILFALGLEDNIVGVTQYSNHPPAARQKPVMGTFWQPNIEAVVAARPDLVIALGFNQQAGLAHRLARLNFNTLTVDIETIPQLFDAIEKIGTVTNKTADAHRLSDRLRNNLDDISRRVADEHRPKVLYIIQIEPLRVAGRQTFINELIELAGGENAIAPTINKYPPVGPEQVIASNPDVIIQPVMDVMEKADLTAGKQQLIEYFDRFQSITAVSGNRIYVIDGDAVSRLGPRIDQAAETIARCLRPELFKEP